MVLFTKEIFPMVVTKKAMLKQQKESLTEYVRHSLEAAKPITNNSHLMPIQPLYPPTFYDSHLVLELSPSSLPLEQQILMPPWITAIQLSLPPPRHWLT